MKRVVVDVSDWLMEQIEELMEKWGFTSRAEFFRHLAINYVEKSNTHPSISGLEKNGGPKDDEDRNEDIGFNIPQKVIDAAKQAAELED